MSYVMLQQEVEGRGGLHAAKVAFARALAPEFGRAVVAEQRLPSSLHGASACTHMMHSRTPDASAAQRDGGSVTIRLHRHRSFAAAGQQLLLHACAASAAVHSAQHGCCASGRSLGWAANA